MRQTKVSFTVTVDLDALESYRREEARLAGTAYSRLSPADVWPFVRRWIMTRLSQTGWPPFLVPPLNEQPTLWTLPPAAASASHRPAEESTGA